MHQPGLQTSLIWRGSRSSERGVLLDGFSPYGSAISPMFVCYIMNSTLVGASTPLPVYAPTKTNVLNHVSPAIIIMQNLSFAWFCFKREIRCSAMRELMLEYCYGSHFLWLFSIPSSCYNLINCGHDASLHISTIQSACNANNANKNRQAWNLKGFFLNLNYFVLYWQW